MKKILSFILVLISVQSIGQTTKLYAVRFNINGTTDSFFVHEFIGNGVYNSTGNYVMPKRDSMVAINGYSFPQSFGRFWLHADNVYRNSPPIAEAVEWANVNGKPSAVTNLSGTNTGDNATNTQYSGLAASKENTITAGTTAQYWRGDKTFQTLDKTAVGLSNVDNTTDVNKPISTATQTALNNKSTIHFGLDAGANDSYVITASPVPSAYTQGMVVIFRANTQNTTGCSINVNSLGVKTIVKRVSTTPATADILAQMFCWLVYDGTNFVILNPVVN